MAVRPGGAEYRIGAETLTSGSVFTNSVHIRPTSAHVSVEIVVRTGHLCQPARGAHDVSDTLQSCTASTSM
jgi:hypothetical protein